MKQSIRHQILAGVLGLAAGLSLLYSAQGFYGINELINTHRKTVSDELARTVRARIAMQLRAADTALEPIVADDRIRGAFGHRDREELQRLLTPMWSGLQKKGMAQLQFHTPPASSFLRMHEPSRYGDDLSTFRATVVKANRDRTAVHGLEEGRGGFGLRVVRPMTGAAGEHIGTVEFGLDFGTHFLKELQTDYGGEFFLYRFSDRDSKAWANKSALLGGTSETDPIPPAREAVSTDWADGHIEQFREGDRLVVLIPVADYAGSYVGLVKAHQDLSAFDRQRMALLALFVITGAIGTALGAGAALLLVHRTFRPLQRCTEITERIAHGDLSATIELDRSDEVGLIYRALDNMRGSLKGLLGKIAEAVQSTTAAARSLESGTTEVTLAAQQVSLTMEHISRDSLRLNELTQKSHQAAEDLEKSALDVGRAAERTRQESAAVLQTSRQVAAAARLSTDMIEKIGALMDRSAESVRVLGSSLENVREFAGSIQGISDEINLLSLNASIEAARAGEAGRGFAVVAQHVSRLADQSGQAVSDIHRTIEDILKDAEATSQAILAGNQQMAEGSRGVQEALQSIGTIETMLERVDGFVGSIADASARQNEEAALVARSMDQVARLIQESVAATEEVAASMEQISGLMASVRDSAGHLAGLAGNMQNETAIFRG